MRKLIRRIPAKLIELIFIGTIFILSSCAISNDGGFAIYLTEGDIPPDRMPALSHIDIAEPPIISMPDITTYNAQTHELKLTASAFERMAQLEVPVSGRSFVVCVDREPIYWGAFWTPISSISFDGVTIWKPLGMEGPHVVRLELGYPSSFFYGGEDPRNNPEVLRSLEQAGKLIDKLSLAAVDALSHSMKGYELYSWSEDGQWHFTLITGTNRYKTLEEIISDEDVISEAGWVQIHAVGADAIKAALSKLPQGEEILWLTGPRAGQAPPAGIDFGLPPEPTVNDIREHAGQCGLELRIQPLS
jgi:hypothetical protein